MPMKALMIPRLPATVLGLLILAGCGGDLSPEEARAKAQAHLDQGEVNAAIIELKNALQEAPDAVAIRRLLGEAYLEAGDLPGARKELSRAVELGERAPTMVLKLITVSVRLGRFDEALDGIELLPTERRIEAATDEGFAFLGLDKPDAAEAAFQRAIEAAVNAPRALVGLATIALRQNDAQAAHAHLDRALKLQPGYRRALLVKGELLLATHRLEEAVGFLNQALEGATGGEKAAAHIALTRAHLALGAPDDAEPHVNALEQLIPDSPQTSYLKGAVAYSRNDRDSAEKELLKVLQFDPDNAPASLLLGSIKFSQGQLEQAEGHLYNYIGKVPDNLTARKLLAGVLLARDQVTSALEVLEERAGLASTDPQYLSLLGSAHMRAGNSDQAAAYFEQAATLSPEDAGIRTRLAVSRLATGAAEDAIAGLEKVVSEGDAGIQPSILLVISHLRENRLDEALDVARTMAETYADNPVSHNMLGAVHLARGEEKKARAGFLAATERTPGFVPAVLNLVRMDLEQEQADTARQRLQEALEHQPDHPRLLLKLAELSFAAGNMEEAESLLQQARLAQPEALEPALVLTRLRIAQRRLKDAAAILESLRERHGQHPEWMTEQARVQLARREFADAADTLEKLLADYPDNQTLRERLALAKVGLGKLEDARSIYQGLLDDTGGRHAGALSQLARIHARQGETDEALEFIARLEQEFPEEVAATVLRGDVLATAGRLDEAAATYREALEGSDSGAILLRLARVIELGGDREGANRVMQEWINAHPEDRTVKLALAGRQQSAGDTGAARRHYEELLRQSPDNPVALNNLAWIYLEMNDPSALQFAEAAHELVPENAAILDTVGWVRLKNGKVESALEALSSAAAKAPDNREIQYHYAAALAESGDTFKAGRILSEILRDGQDFPDRDQAAALLEEIR